MQRGLNCAAEIFPPFIFFFSIFSLPSSSSGAFHPFGIAFLRQRRRGSGGGSFGRMKTTLPVSYSVLRQLRSLKAKKDISKISLW
jgi:hypothetical protein